MTKREDRIGKAGQNLAARTLHQLGIEMVEQIGTPVKLIPHPTQKAYYRVIWGEKVSGDHHGLLPGGRSVLVETKTILDRNLRWSDMREHQPARLSRHAELGGLSLLVWVHESGVHAMEWPVPGFGPGKSIALEKAQACEYSPLQRSAVPMKLCPKCQRYQIPVNQSLCSKCLGW